jgi:hypothetical protein
VNIICNIWSTRWVPKGTGTRRVWIHVKFHTHGHVYGWNFIPINYTGMDMVLLYPAYTLPIVILRHALMTVWKKNGKNWKCRRWTSPSCRNIVDNAYLQTPQINRVIVPTTLWSILLFANTDVSSTKICLDISILAKSIEDTPQGRFMSSIHPSDT